MNLKKISLALAVTMAGIAGAVQAAEPAYDTIDINVSQIDFDGADDNFGLGIAGSLALSKQFYIFAGLDNNTDNSSDSDWGLYRSEIGAGMHLAMSKGVDLTLAAGGMEWRFAEDNDLTADTETEAGLFAEVGVRAALMDGLELGAAMRYLEIDIADNDWSQSAYAQYQFSKDLALGVNLERIDEIDMHTLYARFNF